MYRNTAISIVARRLGNRTDLDDAIADEMVLAQTHLEQYWPSDTLPWFLQKPASGVSTAEGSATVTLPTDFLREMEDGGLLVNNGTSLVPLCKTSVENIWGAEVVSAIPSHYAIFKNTLYLYPTPDAVYPLTFGYFAKALSLSQDTENDWLVYAPELLIAATGMRMAAYVQDDKVGQLFMQQYNDLVREVTATSLSRQLDNQNLFMG